LLKDAIHFCPEILQQSDRVGIGVKANSLSPVGVIEFDSSGCAWSRSFSNRMGIIKSKKAYSLFVMECERVAQAMRPLGSLWNLFHDKLHPTPAYLVDDECFAVEKK
jgi:hypothetical protein